MPTSSPASLRSDRQTWTVMVALAVCSIAVGIWPLSGTATTHFPGLALAPAAGLPYLWPPLRVFPLGGITWDFWAADTLAALVMLFTAWGMLRHSARRNPEPGAGRAFGRAWWVTVVAVVAGNIVRSVFLSIVTHASIGMYLGLLVVGVIVSLLTAAVLGLLVGLVALLLRRRPHAPSP